VRIRPALIEDLPAITEIYNEAILTTTATFDEQIKSAEQMRRWFEAHGERHPVIVAERNGIVVGWASLSEYSDRCAYRDTAETSFYVKEEHRGQGIGRQLHAVLIERARQLGFHSLIARVADGSDVSLHLLTSLGFQLVGKLREVGNKFGRLLDVHVLQLML
jgi:phosphinothricin acetyltransferase